jgi:tellurite resistance protein
MKESNFDITEADLPTLTQQIGVIVKAYADNNANSHKNKLRGVAAGIAGSVEITDDEARELEKHINAIKSSDKIDATAIAHLDSAYAKAKADGKITTGEKANLEAVIKAIHNATNI